MNGKVRYLLENMGWMAISNFASKILVFLMVPYYTRVLTAQDYGLYDLGYTVALLLAPLITMNTGEAIMRFAITEKNDVKRFFSTALTVGVAGCIVCLLVWLACASIPIVQPDIRDIIIGACLVIPSNIFYIAFSQFARGIDKVHHMAIGGLVNSTMLVVLTVLFVSVLGLGVFGCFLGTSLAMLLGGAYIGIRCLFWRYLVKPQATQLRQLVSYGLPLSVNTLGWWANSALSRYVTAVIMGLPSAGLLAAAYKIPAIPKAIQQVFIQAWQISSIKEFDPNDTDGFFSKTYGTVGTLSAMLTSVVIMLIPAIAMILFSDEFYEAWRYVPLLMVCIIFDCLASMLGGVFSAVGNTRPIGTSAAVSVAVTLVISVIGIDLWGIQGACAASAASSFVIWLMRRYGSARYIKLRVNRGLFFAICSVLSLQIAAALLLDIGFVWYSVQIAAVIVMLVISRKAIDYGRLAARISESIRKKKTDESQ